MPRKPTKPAKHKPTAAELANDPSLRWFPYQIPELLWSDDLDDFARFNGYTDDGTRLRLATSQGIAPMDGDHDVLRVRRPMAGDPPQMAYRERHKAEHEATRMTSTPRPRGR